jgi:aminopeptidase N
VDEPGRPTITTELSVRNGRVARLAFRQSDPRGRRLRWPQQLRVVLGTTSGPQTVTVDLHGAAAVVASAAGMAPPQYILPAGGGWAYGNFVLDRATVDYLTANLPDIDDALTRGAAWVTLWDAMLDGRVRPEVLFDLALRALPRETDEQMTSRILAYASTTWWRFLSADARARQAPRFEAVLRAGLAAAATTSQRAAWFNTLRSVALTADTLAWLRRVWEQAEPIAGLPLAETDYTSLALELAVREVDGWHDILTAQLGRIDNPDRRERFRFVMPALSADPAERERWFIALGDVKNRRREPWVLEGLAFLHHPLRAEASKQFVAQSLAMLWDIQKTGDIFFPKRWLDATLGGYNSREVADTVRAFLARLPPGYPDRLRKITLQSADELFRAAELASQ